jgi:hypothetical protein
MAKLSMSDRVVHEQFSTFGRNSKEWSRKCAMLLPEIERRQICHATANLHNISGCAIIKL